MHLFSVLRTDAVCMYVCMHAFFFLALLLVLVDLTNQVNGGRGVSLLSVYY